MSATYLERSLEPVLLRALAEFPAVLVTGPRQAGKTTMLRQVLGTSHRYVSLDRPDVRLAATHDPAGFLSMYPAPLVLDEVQHAPVLLAYLKEKIDADRGAKGRFVLTGSQNLLLSKAVTETLAGRVAVLRLHPLSFREAARDAGAPLPWESPTPNRNLESLGTASAWTTFLRGGYPELAVEPGRDVALWHESYLHTYLERDVRDLRQVGDLSLYQAFVRALAARSAQMLNLSELARELGVATNTARAWLSVLEATHQVFLVRPFVANLSKRLVKTPKIYFADVGTLCHLVGLTTPEHAGRSHMSGAIVETAVVGEVARRLWSRGREPRLSFWRTAAGTEVDLLVEVEGSLHALEIKQSATPNPRMARHLHGLHADLGERLASARVVHLGDMRLPLGCGVEATPLATL